MSIKISDLRNDAVVKYLDIDDTILDDDGKESVRFKTLRGGYVERLNRGLLKLVQIVGVERLEAYIYKGDLVTMSKFLADTYDAPVTKK